MYNDSKEELKKMGRLRKEGCFTQYVDNEISEAFGKVADICYKHGIPFIFTILDNFNEEKEEFRSKIFPPSSAGVYLQDDKIAKMMAVFLNDDVEVKFKEPEIKLPSGKDTI